LRFLAIWRIPRGRMGLGMGTFLGNYCVNS
jgi:hypothetical protein